MLNSISIRILDEVTAFHEQCEDSAVNEDVCGFLKDPDPYKGIDDGTATVYRLFQGLLDLSYRGKEYRPFLEALGLDEKEQGPHYEWVRDHVVHSCFVYCLGVYLYMFFPGLRAALEEEMTRSESEASDDGFPWYSKKTPQGEFAFRWRLAALCHDISYPFERSGCRADEVNKYIDTLNRSLTILGDRLQLDPPALTLDTHNWHDQLDQLPFAESTALCLMEEAAGADALDLHRYWWRSRLCWRAPDHGIASAIFIYRMADLLYKRHNPGEEKRTPEYAWYPRWLTTSMAHSLAPIAYHNLSPTPEDGPTLKRLVASRPLIGLLRMADALQDWDRKYYHDEHEDQKVPACKVSLDVDAGAGLLRVHIQGVDAGRVCRINRELGVLEQFPVRAFVVAEE